MEGERLRLIIWSAFGIFGFFLLIYLLRRIHARHADPIKSAISRRWKISKINGVIESCKPCVIRDFNYHELCLATRGFGSSNLIKRGHSGDFFGAVLKDDEVVVVKRLNKKSATYQSEYGIIIEDILHHRFVPYLGRCLEKEGSIFFVYRYMINGDLADALQRGRYLKKKSDESAKPLDWITRFKILTGVAEGLDYLHNGCKPAMAHRDLKASSVLLDADFEVKLGSLSKLSEQQDEGCRMYDLFCYGKVLLDILSGLDVSDSPDAYTDAWIRKALPLMDYQHQHSFVRFIDPTLVLDEDHLKEVMVVAVLARQCLEPHLDESFGIGFVLECLKNPQVLPEKWTKLDRFMVEFNGQAEFCL